MSIQDDSCRSQFNIFIFVFSCSWVTFFYCVCQRCWQEIFACGEDMRFNRLVEQYSRCEYKKVTIVGASLVWPYNVYVLTVFLIYAYTHVRTEPLERHRPNQRQKITKQRAFCKTEKKAFCIFCCNSRSQPCELGTNQTIFQDEPGGRIKAGFELKHLWNHGKNQWRRSRKRWKSSRHRWKPWENGWKLKCCNYRANLRF